MIVLGELVSKSTKGEKVMLNCVVQEQPTIISDSITKNWTEQALECYKLNGNCAMCSIAKGHYSFVCQMPKVVEILKTVAGEPEIK